MNKALAKENPEKHPGFANSIAYYMKLAYSNWHKETVHDDAIQSELTNLTKGQLEFTNTPYVRAVNHRLSEDRGGRDRDRGGYGDYRNKRNQKFQHQQRDNRDNRGGGGGGRNDNRNNGGGKFNKKRYK